MAALENANTTLEQVDLHDFSWLETTKEWVDISESFEALLNNTERWIENKDRILYAFSQFDENDTREFTSILDENMKLEKPITV